MKISEFIEEVTAGGPGLDGYLYQAEVYCVTCGEEIASEIARKVAPTLSGTDDPLFRDSDTVPQPSFFEAHPDDTCGRCGCTLDDSTWAADDGEQVY